MIQTRKRRIQSFLILLLAACLIAPISESVHGVLLDHLHVPYPYTPGLPNAMLILNLVVRLGATAFFVRCLLPQKWRSRPLALALLGAILMLMLNETLRVVFIESAIEQSLPVALLDAVPKLLIAVEVAIVAFAAATRIRWSFLALCIFITSTIFTLYVSPPLSAQVELWRHIHFANITAHYNVPYPTFLQFRILVGFLEPTFATFVLLSLCWQCLPGAVVRRTAWFTLFLLILRGRVIALLVFSFWVKQRFPVNFLAQSQFFLETAMLAILASVAWAWHSKIASSSLLE